MLLVVRPNDGEGGTEPLIADEDAEMRESGRGKTTIPQLSWSLPTFTYCSGVWRSGSRPWISGFLHSHFVRCAACASTQLVRSHARSSEQYQYLTYRYRYDILVLVDRYNFVLVVSTVVILS